MAPDEGILNEANFLRLHILVMEAQKVLRAKFDSIIKPRELTNMFSKQQTIETLIHTSVVYGHEYNLLFPNPSSENFDISLFARLLLNTSMCNLHPNDVEYIKDIRDVRNKLAHFTVACLKNTEFDKYWGKLAKAIVMLARSCGLRGVRDVIKAVKTKPLDAVTVEMRGLRETTCWFLEHFEQKRKYYIQTKFWEQAVDTLKKKHLVILTGHPGEGKTTMAAHLALNVSTPQNCIKLANASDWRKVDWSLKLFNTVIIDDIFGAGAFNKDYLSEWKRYLPEIELAAKQKRLNVIITTRYYIKEEALDDDELDNKSMFDDYHGCMVHIDSDDLSDEEKNDILLSQAKQSENFEMIRAKGINTEELLRKSKETLNPRNRRNTFVFGFPQCANLFVNSVEMIRLGPTFFQKPEAHFKAYVEQLYNVSNDHMFHKYISFVALWTAPTGRISKDDFQSVAKTSQHIRNVATHFDIEVNRQFIENMKSAMKYHQHDLLTFSDQTGEYTFSHNVIGDIIGVVLGQPRHKPVETIELCPRDFLMDKVTVEESSTKAFKVVVNKVDYHHLCRKLIRMILRQDCNKSVNAVRNFDFHSLKRHGPRSNEIQVVNTIDFGIFQHALFQNKNFVKQFMQVVHDECVDTEMFRTPVMVLTGYFFDYGIRMKEMRMYVPGYMLYRKRIVLVKRFIKNKVFQTDHSDLLLLATHVGDISMMKLLLREGARVSGDTIYVAMHKCPKGENVYLQTLLQYPEIDINDRGNILNGNFPIILASKKGFTDAVECLLENGANLSVQNDNQMTALHMAVIYDHFGIVKTLIRHRAPLNVKGGKFKRTPLHIAADQGSTDVVKFFLSKGSNVYIKDHRGQYPIFLAAIQGHTSTVREFLRHDHEQDRLRIASYGKGSVIKGMSLFHVAVWKNNSTLIDMLIEENANPNITDFFGQTPLLYAIMFSRNKAIRLLLPHADKTKPQKQGHTPLHAAALKGNLKIVGKLAPHSDVNSQDKCGRTPMYLACENGHFETVQYLLIKWHADPGVVTKNGSSVLNILEQKHERKTKCGVNTVQVSCLIRQIHQSTSINSTHTRKRKRKPPPTEINEPQSDLKGVKRFKK